MCLVYWTLSHPVWQLIIQKQTHTCSENSATSMKSLLNWAVELQGFGGGNRGTESSSGRPCSSSPSPNPSVPVKASRSGDPIIVTAGRVPWDGPDFRRWVSCSHGTPKQQPGGLKTCYAVVYNHDGNERNKNLKEFYFRINNCHVNKLRFQERLWRENLTEKRNSLRAAVTRLDILSTGIRVPVSRNKCAYFPPETTCGSVTAIKPKILHPYWAMWQTPGGYRSLLLRKRCFMENQAGPQWLPVTGVKNKTL